jgi:hypothetical protein
LIARKRARQLPAGLTVEFTAMQVVSTILPPAGAQLRLACE